MDKDTQDCEACSFDAQKAPADIVTQFIKGNSSWTIQKEADYRCLTQTYKMADFKSAFHLSELITQIAENHGHHPRLIIEYGSLNVTWWSHKIKDLHQLDLDLAAKCDEAYLSL